MQSNSWNPYYYFILFITLLFLCFAVLSNIPLPGRAYGETGYIEVFQVILIVSVLIVGCVRKSYLINMYSRFTYWLRQSLFGLLLFEEISYLTTNKFKFLDYNIQSELNFHNSSFLNDSFANLTLLGNDPIHLTTKWIIDFLVIVFLFAGFRIPFFKRFRIISLHPLVSAGILFYPFDLGFSYLIRNLLSFRNTYYLVNNELIELFLYIIFLVDILIKSYPRLISNFSKSNKYW